MIFDRYSQSLQQPLNRIQIGHYVIVRSSTKSKCKICGTETHWRKVACAEKLIDMRQAILDFMAKFADTK